MSDDAPLLVIGSGGQVGRALVALAANAVGVTRQEINLEDLQFFSDETGLKPSAIINAAAYTAVDKAEQEEIRAYNVNARAPGILAAYCKAQGIPFIHYSTDYVFDGSGTAAWKETDLPEPINAYGRTKLAGEKKIAEAGGDHLIFRTSWVYDESGKNFLNTMLRLGSEREELKVVNDQFGAPTYARHLAQATLQALEHARKAPRFPSGIYHLCGGGETTWAEFAQTIFNNLSRRERSEAASQLGEVKITGIPAAEYPTPARRPYNSRLDCDKALQVLGIKLPDWRESLQECLERRCA